MLTIEIPGEDIKSIRIVDLTGKTVLLNLGSESNFDVTALSPGIYFFIVNTARSGYTAKLVRQ